jgi:hypothetical protein
MRTTESSFLRQWAGSSLMPALLVWGMRHGTFIVDGAPMEIDQIAEETGYTRKQVQDMLAVADSMIVVEADNESSDNHRSNDS